MNIEEIVVTRKRILAVIEKVIDGLVDVINVGRAQLAGQVTISNEHDVNSIGRIAIVGHGSQRLTRDS